MSEKVEKLWELVKTFKETFDSLTLEEQTELDNLMKKQQEEKKEDK